VDINVQKLLQVYNQFVHPQSSVFYNIYIKHGSMIKLIEIQLKNQNGRPFLLDARFIENGKKKPVILFFHGFKGFKDWGTFNLMADHLANAGFVFVKMNFSMNGTTPEHPADFADLEAFGQNNFSTELNDAGKVIDLLFGQDSPVPSREANLNHFYLMGHSRGGASVLLKTAEDVRVKAAITLAAVSDLASRYPPEILKRWQKEGVIMVPNARTGQEMPMYYQIVEDYQRNEDRLDVFKAVGGIKVPVLSFHGTADESVSLDNLHQIKKFCPNAEIVEVEGANHTFGGTHPYEKPELPQDTLFILEKIVVFLKVLTS
jgi:uncharacterized protein